MTQRGVLFDSRGQVKQAWQNARDAGGYSFRADLVQQAIPLAQTSNIGLTSRSYNFHLEGTTDLSAQKFNMSLWDSGGSVLDPGTASQTKN